MPKRRVNVSINDNDEDRKYHKNKNCMFHEINYKKNTGLYTFRMIHALVAGGPMLSSVNMTASGFGQFGFHFRSLLVHVRLI